MRVGGEPYTTEPNGTPGDQLTDGTGVTRIDPNDPAAAQYRMVDSASADAEALRDAGNRDIELFVREGMPHGFYFFPHVFPQEAEAYAAIRRFLARYLSR